MARCFAYAYITPAAAAAAGACKADPAAVIRRRAADRRVLQGARFEVHDADCTVRFCSPEDREATMEKQPFALADRGGARGRPTTASASGSTTSRLAHVALLRYPKEDIQSNCSGFGHLKEVDPACYDAPDLAPVRVRVVVNMEIPREIRIRCRS